MKPYYDSDGITLYLGDCREVLPQLEIQSELIITSPPYNIGLDYGDGISDNLPDDVWRDFSRTWLKSCFDNAIDGCRIYVAVSEKMLWWFKPMLEEIGWTYSQLFVWCKTNFVGGTRRISGEWNCMTDWFLICRKGKKTPMLRWNETNTTNWYACATPQSNFNEGRFHPAQWPLKLIKRLISRTPGDIILDPFLGSGVTAIAANQLNRKCIGIERKEQNLEIAVKRLAQSVMKL